MADDKKKEKKKKDKDFTNIVLPKAWKTMKHQRDTAQAKANFNDLWKLLGGLVITALVIFIAFGGISIKGVIRSIAKWANAASDKVESVMDKVELTTKEGQPALDFVDEGEQALIDKESSKQSREQGMKNLDKILDIIYDESGENQPTGEVVPTEEATPTDKATPTEEVTPSVSPTEIESEEETKEDSETTETETTETENTESETTESETNKDTSTTKDKSTKKSSKKK